MKNAVLLISALLIGFMASATTVKSDNFFRRGYDGKAFIFVEGDVEFSVFPDGQFDFVYVGPMKENRVTIYSPGVNISYNAGYNYDAFVQYDDYGAVIQVENVPIYYDFYGRIVRAGNVDISYNNRRLVRVGGLHILYNRYGHFSHCTGMINPYNPYYVYRPWHVYYTVPVYTHVIVYDYPYRRYYYPVRYSYNDHIRYYNNRQKISYNNSRRDFYRPGSRVHHQDGRVVRNTDYNPNRTNTMISRGRDNATATTPNPGSSRVENFNLPVRKEVRQEQNTTPIRTHTPSTGTVRSNQEAVRSTRVDQPVKPITVRQTGQQSPVVDRTNATIRTNVKSNSASTNVQRGRTNERNTSRAASSARTRG